MAGGVKKPVNIFNLKTTGEPPQIFNWRLWFAVMAFGLMGAARGVDEGLISGAFNSPDFQKSIHYSKMNARQQANTKANVSAMVQIGSVGGSLFAFMICDRIGRIWATRQLCLVWIFGIALFMGANGNLGMIYAGRFIAGLGVGQTVVVGPVYLAEISPACVRGLCTCVFTGFVYLGIVIAYFANYGTAIHENKKRSQWEIPTSLHIMFAGIIFCLSFLQKESPRYLITKGRTEEAIATLARLRNLPSTDPYIMSEIHAIQVQWEEEQESTMGQGIIGPFKELFLVRSNFFKLYLGFMAQVLSQWSSAGSITVYAVDLFKLLGINGTKESLLATAVFGIVKLIAAVSCALFLVDVIGRKRSLLIGIALQSIAMIYIAAFLTATPKLGVDKKYVLPKSKHGSSVGSIFMIYLSGVGWALGWNSMQYLLTAELFPLRIRALGTGIVMAVHFLMQFGNTRATPVMLLPTAQGGMGPKGFFWFSAAITVIGGIWVFFTIPETSGRTLESMDRLFALPWYKIGLSGNKDADLKDQAYNEKAEVIAEHVEERAEIRDEKTHHV